MNSDENIIINFEMENSINNVISNVSSNISDDNNGIILFHRIIKLNENEVIKVGSCDDFKIYNRLDENDEMTLTPYNFSYLKEHNLTIKIESNELDKILTLLQIEDSNLLNHYNYLISLENFNSKAPTTVNSSKITNQDSTNPNSIDKNKIIADIKLYNYEKLENINELLNKADDAIFSYKTKINTYRINDDKNILSASYIITSNSKVKEFPIKSNINTSIHKSFIQSEYELFKTIDFIRNYNKVDNTEIDTNILNLLLFKKLMIYINNRKRFEEETNHANTKAIVPFCEYFREQLFREKRLCSYFNEYLSNFKIDDLFKSLIPNHYDLLNLIDKSFLKTYNKVEIRDKITKIENSYFNFINELNKLLDLQNISALLDKYGHTESYLISKILFNEEGLDSKEVLKSSFIKMIKESEIDIDNPQTKITLQIKSYREPCKMCKSNLSNLRREMIETLKDIGYKGSFDLLFFYSFRDPNKKDTNEKDSNKTISNKTNPNKTYLNNKNPNKNDKSNDPLSKSKKISVKSLSESLIEFYKAYMKTLSGEKLEKFFSLFSRIYSPAENVNSNRFLEISLNKSKNLENYAFIKCNRENVFLSGGKNSS